MTPVSALTRRAGACAATLLLAAFAAGSDRAEAGDVAPTDAVSQAQDPTANTMGGSHDGMAGMAGMQGMAGMDMNESHAAIPAGVFGAHMVDGGAFGLMYTPMIMGMAHNYIGSTQVSQQYIATQIPYVPTPGAMMKPPTLRIVPASMTADMNMFHIMYGITDSFNLMIMGNYMVKSMTMTSFTGMKGSTELGNSSSSTQGWGDTSFLGLVRVYQDEINHVHLNLGFSAPTGSVTESATMLNPMNQWMTMRAMYAMQPGTGTYDALYGITYTGKLGAWSWGFVYRGRAAFSNNDQGYRWGPSNEMTGWAAYEALPGLSLTARAAGTVWGSIHGSDPEINGPMQGANPNYYGGQRVEMFGGLEYKTAALGTPVRVALEAGAPIYQNLNGPQMGKAWQVNLAAGVRF
jgi:hypothetical protein